MRAARLTAGLMLGGGLFLLALLLMVSGCANPSPADEEEFSPRQIIDGNRDLVFPRQATP